MNRIQNFLFWPLFVLLMVMPAHAQIVGTPSSTPQNVQNKRVISPDVSKHLLSTQLDAKHAAYQANLQKLEGLLKLETLNPYETSLIYQNIGVTQYELDNSEAAIESFEAAISTGGFNEQESENLRINIAQLLIGEGQYARGALMLEDFEQAGGTLKPQHIEYLTQAWVQAENYENALPWAEMWFDNAAPKKRKHYDLLNFLYSNLGLLEKQTELIKTMLGIWPEDKGVWQNLRSLLASQGLEQEAFVVWKQMYDLGLIEDERDIILLAEAFGTHDTPYEGAKLLERDMRAGRVGTTDAAYRVLGGLWYDAREHDKAEEAYSQIKFHTDNADNSIAKLRGTGAFNDYFQSWADAAGKVRRCDGVETAMRETQHSAYDKAKVWILIGICHYEVASKLPKERCYTRSEDNGEARRNAQDKALAKFGKVGESHRKYSDAQRWIKVIKAEQGRDGNLDCGCSFGPELCYIKIRQAYDAQVFTNKFELDEDCEPHKAEFDYLYR